MSFDIIILKPANCDVKDLTSIQGADPIGAPKSVHDECDSVFPGAATGSHLNREYFAVEVSTSGSPVTSVHMALRFGAAWSDETYTPFIEHLARLCHKLGCVAFAVSDNSRLAP
ncbi:hypothetical protein ACI2S5_26155 [Ralstonia nicotianae]|uniref:hypothetical protein n=1 Tax=Ralstonia pseudosolanacearum TaxID=1310165 RepID=UPI0007D75EFF|nr:MULTISPECIES: hypothetical protein [Ralstonia]QKL54741.1 hypothetical protein HI816_23470 [Ralstonia solanacearum]MDO3516081.1 hypothetical protein [Ralstonia pseudosolanacearum]MDO3544862.1 hypothetical protein [Ralstonia pseudosolanacearum]OAI60374.1 hypothetical protein RSP781_22500 [Ralstonia pseudosolanacearum]QKM25994.1 hypothetical protein HI796_23465 [Ralstonia solanacearum]